MAGALQIRSRQAELAGTDLDNTVKNMDATLNTQVGKYASSEWAAAKRFLRELRIEIKNLIRR